MSTYLYLDTSSTVICALAKFKSSKWEWLEYQEEISLKGSKVLHSLIYESLKKHNLELSDLSGIFMSSGPGSYTGMRLSEGLAQVFEWQDFKIYSFYHFKIPWLYKFDTGQWVSEAFKGEVFVYSWQGDDFRDELLPKDEFLKREVSGHLFGFLRSKALEDSKFDKFFSTKDLIFQNPAPLFDHLLKTNAREAPYYFRPLSSEFKVSK